MSAVVVSLYTIQILGSNKPGAPLIDPGHTAALMAEIEENLTDLLPAGYRARIRRWDDNTDEPTQEDRP